MSGTPLIMMRTSLETLPRAVAVSPCSQAWRYCSEASATAVLSEADPAALFGRQAGATNTTSAAAANHFIGALRMRKGLLCDIAKTAARQAGYGVAVIVSE